jgi:hypothetical protein
VHTEVGETMEGGGRIPFLRHFGVLGHTFIGGMKEWCERLLNGEVVDYLRKRKKRKREEKFFGTVNERRKIGVGRDNADKCLNPYHTSKSPKPEQVGGRNGSYSCGGLGGDPGSTNPVCVGAGDSITVAKSLSSDSNRANVSARYVARFISHLASHSESTVK